jgi:hypothetical protein
MAVDDTSDSTVAAPATEMVPEPWKLVALMWPDVETEALCTADADMAPDRNSVAAVTAPDTDADAEVSAALVLSPPAPMTAAAVLSVADAVTALLTRNEDAETMPAVSEAAVENPLAPTTTPAAVSVVAVEIPPLAIKETAETAPSVEMPPSPVESEAPATAALETMLPTVVTAADVMVPAVDTPIDETSCVAVSGPLQTTEGVGFAAVETMEYGKSDRLK